MDELKTVESLGFTMPSAAYLFGALLFSLIGYAAYRYGKKASRSTTMWLGVALMLYPYVVSDTLAMYAVGTALCAGLYFWRR